MDHLQWPITPVGAARHEKRKRKTSDGPGVAERLARENSRSSSSSTGSGTGNVSASAVTGLIERQNSSSSRGGHFRVDQLEEVSEEDLATEEELELLDDEPLTGGGISSDKAEKYRDLKRRSSFSSTDLNLLDEDELRKSSEDGLYSAPGGLVGEVGVSDSRINIGGGFRIDTPSPPLLSPIGGSRISSSSGFCNSWRLFVALIGIICIVGLLASMASSIDPNGNAMEQKPSDNSKGPNHGSAVPVDGQDGHSSGDQGDGSSTDKSDGSEVPANGSGDNNNSSGNGEKDFSEGSTTPNSSQGHWMSTLLVGGSCLLGCVSIARIYQRRNADDQVLMVHADDELHNVIEKARAQWRAGHFGAEHGSASPHIEPNAAQRAWAAQNIASLELS